MLKIETRSIHLSKTILWSNTVFGSYKGLTKAHKAKLIEDFEIEIIQLIPENETKNRKDPHTISFHTALAPQLVGCQEI
jgi:hypothetical protein